MQTLTEVWYVLHQGIASAHGACEQLCISYDSSHNMQLAVDL